MYEIYIGEFLAMETGSIGRGGFSRVLLGTDVLNQYLPICDSLAALISHQSPITGFISYAAIYVDYFRRECLPVKCVNEDVDVICGKTHF